VPDTDISKYLESQIERRGIPAMVAAVVSGCDIVATGAAGVRERGAPQRVTLNDLFHLGSETKSMAATLAAILVEEGKIQWETNLAEAFSDIDMSVPPAYRQMTLRQLLTHRSGIPGNVLGDPQVMQHLDEFEVKYPGPLLDARRACVRDLLANKAPSATAGEFHYSDANYLIAGHILETKLGKPYENLIRERLFTPLNMTTAGSGPPGRAGQIDEPRGHTADGRPVRPGTRDADNPALYGPSGGVHASIGDWAEYAAFHATKGECAPGLVARESFDALHSPLKTANDPELEAVAPQSAGHAMGWFVFPDGVLTHSGTNLRWFAEIMVIPADRLAVVVACNQGGDEAEKACLEVLLKLATDFRGQR
jgi:CubicO group peptidase (beta-lactamase class C family)